MDTTKTTSRLYCNQAALDKGLDPVGSAGDFDDAIIVEMPLPWKQGIYQDRETLSSEIVDLLVLWLQRYHDGQGYRHRPLMIAPDPAYSRPGFRRVMFYTRPAGAFAQFDKVEYLVPEKLIGPLVWSLYEAPEDRPRFDEYRVPEHDSTRDILVCTHGTVDAACAKFGYPLYRHMRDTYDRPDLRVWRVSHFGGHVYAPTLMDMPYGHYWAYVESEQAEQIIRQKGPVRALYPHYRGWAGLGSSFLQAAEREIWMQQGWAWFDYPKSGETLAQDPEKDQPQWAEVCIRYQAAAPTRTGEYRASVRVQHKIETSHSSGEEHLYAYPQYMVSDSQPHNPVTFAQTDRADR